MAEMRWRDDATTMDEPEWREREERWERLSRCVRLDQLGLSYPSRALTARQQPSVLVSALQWPREGQNAITRVSAAIYCKLPQEWSLCDKITSVGIKL
jgi:hypothetical protein